MLKSLRNQLVYWLISSLPFRTTFAMSMLPNFMQYMDGLAGFTVKCLDCQHVSVTVEDMMKLATRGHCHMCGKAAKSLGWGGVSGHPGSYIYLPQPALACQLTSPHRNP